MEAVMNSQTRIIVIRLKETIITAVIVLAIIILLLMLILSFTNGGKDSAVAANTSNTSSSYIPGVYTSSITLGGNPIEVQVSLDENHINDIQLANISESVTTMYPLIQDSFNDIANEVIRQGSTNITYTSDNKYTASLFLNAINNAINKAK